MSASLHMPRQVSVTGAASRCCLTVTLSLFLQREKSNAFVLSFPPESVTEGARCALVDRTTCETDLLDIQCSLSFSIYGLS